MNKTVLTSIATVLALVLAACGPSQLELDATATQAAAAQFATQTAAAPTATPTSTPTPTSTATSTPTSTPRPSPTPSPPPGLGFTRAEIQAAYEELGFSFGAPQQGLSGEEVYAENRSELRLAQVFIAGDEHTTMEVSVFVYVPLQPSVDQKAAAFAYLARLLETVLPSWEEGIDWLGQSLDNVTPGGNIVTVQHGAKVKIELWPGLRDEWIYWLTVSD